ncbi:MAG TPA: histidine--tRNA ligase, partial [Candidatus Saccharibacteria bacterium]|nr:histidine--tRNA ligase [Candidatus Saccharibacteria bacterium]
GSDTNLTLRYDLTVPLARYVAEHQSDLAFPFRRYHIGKVHRAERAQAGRFREFYQCDIDVIGSHSPVADAETLAAINSIFEQFNFGDFVIHINNRMLLAGFFESIGLKEGVVPGVLRTIDKMEKISSKQLTEEFEKLGINSQQITAILDFVKMSGSNHEIIAGLKKLGIKNVQFSQGVEKLEAVLLALRSMNVPEKHVVVDLKIARGLDYYTGTVFETILSDYPQIGSVCSGGRYDNLASYYTKTELPGVGASIGLSRMFYALQEVGAIKATSNTPANVVVIPIDEAQHNYAITVAGDLRKQGISTVLYTEPDKLGKKLTYANRQGFRYAVIIGEDEVKKKVVTLKNLEKGTGETVKVKKLAGKLR